MKQSLASETFPSLSNFHPRLSQFKTKEKSTVSPQLSVLKTKPGNRNSQ